MQFASWPERRFFARSDKDHWKLQRGRSKLSSAKVNIYFTMAVNVKMLIEFAPS